MEFTENRILTVFNFFQFFHKAWKNSLNYKNSEVNHFQFFQKIMAREQEWNAWKNGNCPDYSEKADKAGMQMYKKFVDFLLIKKIIFNFSKIFKNF